MKRKGNDGQVSNSSTRAAVFVLCVEKIGLEFFYQFRDQGLLNMADNRTSSVRDVCSS